MHGVWGLKEVVAKMNNAIYKWEQNLQRSWEVVTEDKEGNIRVEIAPGSSGISGSLRNAEQDRLACIRRGLIRYMVCKIYVNIYIRILAFVTVTYLVYFIDYGHRL